MALKDVPREAYYINTKCCRYQPDILEVRLLARSVPFSLIFETFERD